MTNKEYLSDVDIGSLYTIYPCSDGRVRAYNRLTKKVESYPRIVIEKFTGKKLHTDDDIHHKDENPLNNKISNLEILKHGVHQELHARKYTDKYVKCPICKKVFLWTANSQKRFYSNINKKMNNEKYFNASGTVTRKPFCSKRCSGIYSQKIQMKMKCNSV